MPPRMDARSNSQADWILVHIMTLTERLSLLVKGLSVSGPGSGAALPQDLRERLLICLPAPVQGLIARHNRRFIIEAEGERARLSLITGLETRDLGEMLVTQPGALPEDIRAQDPDQRLTTELRLPTAAVLVRSVAFPAQVRANLPQVIRYELDRLSPFPASEVAFDFVLHSGAKRAERLNISLALCRRGLVEAWIKRLDELGSPIDRITWEGAWAGANLLPPEQRPRHPRVRFGLVTVSILASLLLGAAVLITPLVQNHLVAHQLAAELKSIRGQAVAVDEVRQELERARQGSTAVLQHKLKQLPLLDILRELTDRLPEDTWIQNLEFANGQVDIRGESGHATALIAILEQSPLIEGVSFGSPVTQVARTGKERFNISFHYEPQSPE